jgi:hypothetical protein
MDCPICKKELEYIECGAATIRDGNSVYQCVEKHHRFWIHPFQNNVIWWYPTANAEDWRYFLCWKIKENDYEIQNIDTENLIGEVLYIQNDLDCYRNIVIDKYNKLSNIKFKLKKLIDEKTLSNIDYNEALTKLYEDFK